MFSWPTFLLDARPYLLLKSRNNSNIIFLVLYARIRNKGCLRCNFEYGAGDISLLKSTFLNTMLQIDDSLKPSQLKKSLGGEQSIYSFVVHYFSNSLLNQPM